MHYYKFEVRMDIFEFNYRVEILTNTLFQDPVFPVCVLKLYEAIYF